MDPPIEEKLIYKDDKIGYFCGIYNYYYDFLFGKKRMYTIQEMGKNWCGYIFSVNDEKIFWGVNLSHVNFLSEQFRRIGIKNNEDIQDLDMQKAQNEFLEFFEENSKQSIYNNDFLSVGNDGYILLKLK